MLSHEAVHTGKHQVAVRHGAIREVRAQGGIRDTRGKGYDIYLVLERSMFARHVRTRVRKQIFTANVGNINVCV